MEETLEILKIWNPHGAGFHLYIIGQRGASTIPQMICSLWVGYQLEGWQEHSISRFKTPLRICFDLPKVALDWTSEWDRVIEREPGEIKNQFIVNH